MLQLNRLNKQSLKQAREDAPVQIDEETSDIESIQLANELLEDAGHSASLCTNEEALIEALFDIHVSTGVVLGKLPNSSLTEKDEVMLTEYNEEEFNMILEFAAKFA